MGFINNKESSQNRPHIGMTEVRYIQEDKTISKRFSLNAIAIWVGSGILFISIMAFAVYAHIQFIQAVCK